MTENFESFLVSNLKRRAVEVSERHMTDEELELMKQGPNRDVL